MYSTILRYIAFVLGNFYQSNSNLLCLACPCARIEDTACSDPHEFASCIVVAPSDRLSALSQLIKFHTAFIEASKCYSQMSERRRKYEDDEKRHYRSSHHCSTRDRSRSRSPIDDEEIKRLQEVARRERMSRLRADEEQKLDEEDDEAFPKEPKEDDDEDDAMAQLMGFSGFGSTKGEPVEDNHKGAARGAAAKNKARKYRQYMNRKGGFNRALDKMP